MFRRRRPLSLRARATAWYVGMLTVALLVFSIFVYTGVRTYLKVRIQRGLSGTANSITQTFSARTGQPDEAIRQDLRNTYIRMPDDHFVRVSLAGKTFFQAGNMLDPALPLSVITLPAYSDVAAYHRQHINGRTVMTYTVPFTTADGRVLLIESGTSLRMLQERADSLAKILCLGSVVIIIAAAFGGYSLMKQPLRPLVTLAEKAEAIGRTELGERLPVIPTGDELERLTVSLNRMIGRLEDSLAHNHRFSADASHELRTPLMIMHGEVEELLEREDLPEPAVGNLVSLLEEIERMSRIVSSLMTITRLDTGERMDLQPIDLAEMIRSTADHMRLLAEARSILLEFAPGAAVLVLGDSMRISQVLVNLIDNAIKYTPPAANAVSAAERRVLLTLTAHDGFAELVISDRGMGIATESLPYVFDRFYRADYARTRVAGGEGLGLAIVKAIIDAHHGSIAITSELGTGSTVNVRLPLATASLVQSPA